MTELDHLKRIKNKAKKCVKDSEMNLGLEFRDHTMTVSPYRMDALAEEIEKYEKWKKKLKRT